MDLKTKVSIEVVKSDKDVKREYMFLMPWGAPLGEVHDVCHEVLQKVVDMAQGAADKVKQNKRDDMPQESGSD